MIRSEETGAMTPQRLSHHLDEIAGLADALAIVSENDGDRSMHSIGAVANDMSRRLDALTPKPMILWRTQQAYLESG